jgi:transposase
MLEAGNPRLAGHRSLDASISLATRRSMPISRTEQQHRLRAGAVRIDGMKRLADPAVVAYRSTRIRRAHGAKEQPAMEYGAIDLHTKHSQIRIVTADGTVIVERRIVTRPDQFAAVFGGRDPMRILLESSTEREWVATCLEDVGHEVAVADPNFAAMYGRRTRRIKTDRRDVAALAEANASWPHVRADG